MRHRWLALAITCIVAVCLLPALAFASSRVAPTRTAVRIGAVHHQTLPLRLAIPNSSPTVDPALVADEENVQLAELLYSGLVRLNPHYDVVPDLASRYVLSKDHKTYTFYLRKGLRFSNGDPVTAYDFRYSIQRSLNPVLKSPSAPTYLLDIVGASAELEGKSKSVSGIKVLDPYTLQIRVRWPVPYFLMELTYPTSFVLDRKRISKLGSIDNIAWYASPAGTGPFRLKSWSPNTRIVLSRNPYYLGTKSTIKVVDITLGPLPTSDLYSYVSQNLDAVSLPSYDSALLHRPGIRETNMLAIDGIYMNMGHKPFDRPAVRRALTLALNRAALVKHALGLTASPFAGNVPPGQVGYDSDLHVLANDGVAARRALKTAGFSASNPFPALTLYHADDPTIAKLATSIAASWHKVLGISVDAKPLTLNTLLSKVQSGTLPLYVLGWSPDYPDPHDWLSMNWESTAANNNVHYVNKQFDALVETADVTWPGKERNRLYNAAQQTLASDAAWIPLYIPHRLVYVRPGVANLVLTGYGLIPSQGSWANVRLSALVPKSG